MAVLVLGGAGYIGSHTVYGLAERGEDVVVADNLATGHIAALHPKARFYEGDIRDRAFLDHLLSAEKIDGVIHFAACSVVPESVANPLKYYSNNLAGTGTLLEALVAHGVGNIVFSSTAAVYGEPEHVPIAETDRTVPGNPYGETKLGMERMFSWVERAHGTRYVSLRYFNACGAHESGRIGEDHAPESHLIPIILKTANGQRESFDIYGDDYDTPDGTCIRDYIHVDDLTSAHILALDYLRAGGGSEVFNLGNGTGFSVRAVLSAAESVTGKHIDAHIKPRRAGDPARLVASSEKAKSVLGWNPKHTSIESIIASADRWQSGHPDGYGDKR